ncbi:MAG: response regulator transcription factor [Bacteroidota bacterium]
MDFLDKQLILCVEDDPSLRTLIEQNLRFEGYEVLLAENGAKALDILDKEAVDLVLLDLMLPKMSGIEICKQLRAKGNEVAVIMLTARDAMEDKVRGLKTGADDYISKPFELMELLARIEAVLRRGKKSVVYKDSFQLGSIQIDFKERIVVKEGKSHSMTQQESLLLQYLVHREGKVLSREEIFEDIWGHEHLYSMRTIDTHINKLRQKIEERPSKPRHILTIHRVGYRFIL